MPLFKTELEEYEKNTLRNIIRFCEENNTTIIKGTPENLAKTSAFTNEDFVCFADRLSVLRDMGYIKSKFSEFYNINDELHFEITDKGRHFEK